MKIIFWGKGERGIQCLKKLATAPYEIVAVVGEPGDRLAEIAKPLGMPFFAPADPHSAEFLATLKSLKSDVFVLGGYGKILREPAFSVPAKNCINLHGGKLPEYRGSSPMNWALINGEKSFSISVIEVVSGVDAGDVLLEREFPLSTSSTIKDLHEIANRNFPEMILEVLAAIQGGKLNPRRQVKANARYFPLRFPGDGFVLWDQMDAEAIHNTIRALTEPYPCAFTFFNGRKVRLLSSSLHDSFFSGEPGRVYRCSEAGILVAARDRALWVHKAKFSDTDEDALPTIQRYESFATLKGTALKIFEEKSR